MSYLVDLNANIFPLTQPLIGLALALCVLAGCKAELQHGLSESEANEMVVVLEQNGISSEKARDPSGDDLWMVLVPTSVQVEAWKALHMEGLPRGTPTGFQDFYPRGGLVPTGHEERIVLQYATAQELRKGLMTVEGVIDAHINLVLPEKPRIRLSNAQVEPPRASVLVKYQSRTDQKPPLTEAEIKALVVGGVEGLEPERVSIILTPVAPRSTTTRAPPFEQVGFIGVAPQSKTMLQILIGSLVGALILLATALGYLLIRRRARAT